MPIVKKNVVKAVAKTIASKLAKPKSPLAAKRSIAIASDALASQRQLSIQLFGKFQHGSKPIGPDTEARMLTINGRIPLPHRDRVWHAVDALLSPDKTFYVEVALRTIPISKAEPAKAARNR